MSDYTSDEYFSEGDRQYAVWLVRENALQARIDALEAANKWIPVEEGYPEKEYADIGDEVLVYLDYPYCRVTTMKFQYCEGVPTFYTGYWHAEHHNWTRKVTHWRHLPTPPEVKE